MALFDDFFKRSPDKSSATNLAAPGSGVRINLTSTGQSSVDFAQVMKTPSFKKDLAAIAEISNLAAASK
jgi:hypothetical protein